MLGRRTGLASTALPTAKGGAGHPDRPGDGATRWPQRKTPTAVLFEEALISDEVLAEEYSEPQVPGKHPRALAKGQPTPKGLRANGLIGSVALSFGSLINRMMIATTVPTEMARVYRSSHAAALHSRLRAATTTRSRNG